jgi:hypothetical protein
MIVYDPDSISYLPYLQDFILYLSSNSPRFDATWPECPGHVGWLMEDPPIPLHRVQETWYP